MTENGYDIGLVDDQSPNFEEEEALKSLQLLIIEMDVIVKKPITLYLCWKDFVIRTIVKC